MVIRVWMEPGEGGMRGRIVSSADAVAGDPVAVSSPDAVFDTVRDWLEDFLTARAIES